MGLQPDFLPPRSPRWPPWAVATSVALHVALVVTLVLSFVPVRRVAESHLLVSLVSPPRSTARQVHTRPPSASSTGLPPDGGVAPALARVLPNATVVQPSVAEPVELEAVDSAPGRAASGGAAAFPWPSFANGVLWDRRPVAQPPMARTLAQLTDSAAKAMINHYLDSLAGLPGGGRVLPPSWKATIAGQDFGLDGQFVTVAGVRIPSLVLGLIPLPVGGNESKALDKGAWMRAEDYTLAMPREAAAADQREEAKKIRQRVEAERELNRRQRESPE